MKEFQKRLEEARKERLEERRKERILERKVQRRIEKEERERKEKEERERRGRKCSELPSGEFTELSLWPQLFKGWLIYYYPLDKLLSRR